MTSSPVDTIRRSRRLAGLPSVEYEEEEEEWFSDSEEDMEEGNEPLSSSTYVCLKFTQISLFLGGLVAVIASF
jgi:hypothetical protein